MSDDPGRVDQVPLEQLLLAAQRCVDEGQVLLVELLAQDISEVHATQLLRCHPVPLAVGDVSDGVAKVGVPVGHQCGQPVEERAESAPVHQRVANPVTRSRDDIYSFCWSNA